MNRQLGQALKEGAVLGIEVGVVELAETPVERPKKSSAATTAGRKSALPPQARLWLSTRANES